jgi:ketosteroid isomerase-like protein
MHTKALVLSTVAFLAAFATAAACFANDNRPSADETAAVEQATAQFYTSLNAMFTGDLDPMQAIWSHADDVTYMGPDGGFKVGWSDVLPIWQSQAALKLGGKVEPTDLRVTVGDNVAFSQCIERGNNVDAQGRTEQVSIRATNLFRKENGQWKMIGHHTDLLPFLEKETIKKSVE